MSESKYQSLIILFNKKYIGIKNNIYYSLRT